MIQLIVSIRQEREPNGNAALSTQLAMLNVHPSTEIETKSAEHLGVLFTEAMHAWHAHWREQGVVESFTAIERDKP